ncbi:MAG: LPS-assembly protein LptD [Gammaproteobacteria bacterium]
MPFAAVYPADEDFWNCEQSGTNKEWVCVSGDKTPTKVPDTGKSQPTAVSKPPSPSPSALAEKTPIVEHVPVKPLPLKPISAAPPAVAQRKGWQCEAGEGDETWSCNLTGSDPKGQARIVPDGDEDRYSLFTPAFDYDQEQIFDILHSELKYDPWEKCTTYLGAPPDFLSTKDLRATTPMDIKADYSEIFDNEVTGFFGNVDITRADQHLAAEKVHYDTVSETLDAQGNVFYSEDALSLYSETMMLKLGSDEARLRRALFISPSTPIRGSAKVVYRDSKSLSRYTEAAFTSCRPGNQDWVLHASKMKLNKVSGKGSATGAWLEFKGVPVIYTPYIAFPLDDRRLSGFLAPSFGLSDKNGYDIAVPYYWNLAPNYDMTFRPRYLSKRGLMLAGDARHLSKISKSQLTVELLPNDSLTDRTRYLGALKSDIRLTQHVTANIDANHVSDKDYFNDLGSNISFSDFRFLKSRAAVNYNRPGVGFLTQFENYQVVDKSILPDAQPYRRLPQVLLDLKHTFDFMPMEVSMTGEYVDFQHTGRTKIEGERVNVKPSIAFPMAVAGAFLTPRFSLQHTQYFLRDQTVGKSGNLSRTLPTLSLDSGVLLERDFDLAGAPYIHTIEPRLFYLYVPTKDQTAIPLFDTAEFDFNFNTLFRENLYSGEDRVQDANQVTAAVTSRVINSKTGRESLKLSVGEIFYLKDRQVCLNFNADGSCNLDNSLLGSPNNSFSNLVTEFNAQLTEHLLFKSALQWDHYENQITRAQVDLRYWNRPEQIVNLGYRFRQKSNGDDLLEQTDVSFRWPLYDNWYFVGRWQYSLFFNSTIESFAGLEKESCCWRFRIIGRRYVNTINTLVGQTFSGDSQAGVFVQLELKGLSAFGDKLDQFFEKNINGYRKPEQ